MAAGLRPGGMQPCSARPSPVPAAARPPPRRQAGSRCSRAPRAAATGSARSTGRRRVTTTGGCSCTAASAWPGSRPPSATSWRLPSTSSWTASRRRSGTPWRRSKRSGWPPTSRPSQPHWGLTLSTPTTSRAERQETEMTAPTVTRWIYDFDEGSREMRDLLGGKGANVAEMTRLLGAERVPAGFTITTEACVAYMRGGRVAPEGLDAAIDEALARLEHEAGRRLGAADDPLLVSVRSGARESMPGMMDTVLNLGMTDESVRGLAERTGNERFAWDSYRRFVQMFANVCRGVPGDAIEAAISEQKERAGVAL